MEILRNIFRRKLRSILTIMGIAIGMFAFVVMGSLALKFYNMIQGGKKYYTGQITIMPKGTGAMSYGTSTLPVDTLNKIKEIDGVEAVEANIDMLLKETNLDDPDSSMVSLGSPPMITGVDVNSNFTNKHWNVLKMKDGKVIDKDSGLYDVTVGYTIAVDQNLKIGDKMNIRGKEFNVIGIIEKTMTAPDTEVIMRIETARELYVEANPFLKSLKEESEKALQFTEDELNTMTGEVKEQVLKSRAFKLEDLTTSAAVSWKDGYNAEDVAKRIKERFKDDILVFSPAKMGAELDKASAIFNSITLGGAVMALIIGTFSIINTMLMTINERKREIGIKKAIGASSAQIAKEYTLEAGFIGLIGSIIGVIMGSIAILSLNSIMAKKGAEIFEFNPTFLIEVILFGFLLGMIAGFIPAISASKLKPVKAIKEL